MRRRVTYRPSKAQGIFGMVWGGAFICIGLFVVIPTFGPFGVLWTLAAIAITVMNGYQAFGKKYAGPEIRIEEEGANGEGAEARLKKLQALYDQRLITQEEYEEKRGKILEEL